MKKTTGQFLVLGTGGSMGIPVIGCECSVCKSSDPHNKRFRSSGLAIIDNKKILIDCGPDFRQQAFKFNLSKPDGVILTHAHNDHTAGLDELRAYFLKNRAKIPVLLSQETAKDIHTRFDYMFKDSQQKETLTPTFSLQLFEEERGLTSFLDLPIKYMTFEQGGMKVNGIRLGNFAYVSDIRHYPETIFEDLKGIEILIVSALRNEHSHQHFTVDEAIEFSNKIGPKQTWFTHISHELDHDKTNARLPSNIKMGYDGLLIDFEVNI